MSSSFRTILAALSLVVLGAAGGITFDRLHVRHTLRIGVDQITHQRALDLLEERIELRPGQRERIMAILHTRQAGIDSAWHQAQQHIRLNVENVVNEIAAELDPDQLAAFRALVAELHGEGQRPIFH